MNVNKNRFGPSWPPVGEFMHQIKLVFLLPIDQGGHDGSSELHPDAAASNGGQPRQFVGFCNPEDLDNVVSQQHAPSTSSNGGASTASRPIRKRGRKQFLPDVLKEPHDSIGR